jgi:integrase
MPISIRDIELSDVEERYLESKTTSTKETYSYALRRFKKFYPSGLGGFIQEIDKQSKLNEGLPFEQRVRPGEQTIREFIKWLEGYNYAPKSIRQNLAAIQNALKFYGISMSFEFIELPPSRPLRQNDKHQWSLDHIRDFVKAAEYVRDKAYIMFQFQSGLSVGDITALNYGDIRREYEAGTMPLAIEGYRKKSGIPIRTFIGRDALHYLRLYLESRVNLENDSPLFTMLGSEERITVGAIQKQLRKYAEKLDFIYDEDLENGYSPVRSHSLRSGFRSRLTGKMDEQLIEFFMSHDIGESKRTYINQPLDELRKLYANHEILLAIHRTSEKEKEKKSKTPEEYQAEIKQLNNKINVFKDELIKQGNAAKEALKEIEKQSRQIESLMRRLEALENEP